MKVRVVLKHAKDTNQAIKISKVLAKQFNISEQKAYGFVKRAPFNIFKNIEEEKFIELKKDYVDTGAEFDVIPIKNEKVQKKVENKKVYYKKNINEDEVEKSYVKNDFLIKFLFISGILIFIFSIALAIFLITNKSDRTHHADVHIKKKLNKKTVLKKIKENRIFSNNLDGDAKSYYLNGDWKKAIAVIENNIKNGLVNANDYKLLGIIKYNIAYRKAMKNNWAGYAEDIDDFWKNSDINDAIVAFKKSILLNKDDYEVYNFLGVIFQEKGWYNKSENAFKKSLSINGRYCEAIYNLGLLNIDKNNFENAEKYFNLCIKMDSNYCNAIYAKGVMYLDDLYDTLEAKKTFRKYLSCNPQDPKTVVVKRILKQLK